MIEHKLLYAAFTSRKAYDTLAKYRTNEELSDRAKIVWSFIDQFYQNDHEISSCDRELYVSWLERHHPKHVDVLKTAVEAPGEEISIENVLSYALDLKRQAAGLKLSSALVNDADPDTVRSLLDEYDKLLSSTALEGDTISVYTGTDVRSLVDAVSGTNLVKLHPKALNDAIGGGVNRGHHILLFARPEVGKSLFAINLTYGFLQQGLKTLYVGNEDPYTQMLLRIVSRLSGMPKADIVQAPEKAQEIAIDRGYNNLIFASLHPGTLYEIRELCEIYEPDCLIVDQLRNLKVRSQSKVEQLEQAAQGVRALIQEFNMVGVSVTQAGDSANNKQVLDMGDVDFSNTGIPAQVDLMIGIGMNDQLYLSNQRMLSLCKNKINGNHNPFLVRVDRVLHSVL